MGNSRLLPADRRRLGFLTEGSGVEFRGSDEVDEFVPRRNVVRIAKDARLTVRRAGLRGEARRCLLVSRWLRQRFDVAGHVERPSPDDIDGLTDKVAFGIAHECVDAWVLEGHTPTSEDRSRERRTVGFDPFRQPERLTHKEHLKTSVKGLLRRLEFDESACVERLWETGGADDTGSKPFLVQLRSLLSG